MTKLLAVQAAVLRVLRMLPVALAEVMLRVARELNDRFSKLQRREVVLVAALTMRWKTSRVCPRARVFPFVMGS